MARIRSLKPEFFTSEQISSVSVEARYLFQGIWVFGDDEGLVKHSAKALKMKVFPGDDIDTAPLLTELIDAKLVVRVASDQGELLWVPTFHNHQSPRKPTPTRFTGVGHPFVAHHSPGSTAPVTDHCRPGSAPDGNQGGNASAPPPLERRGEEGKGEERKGASSEVAVATTRPEYEALLDLLDELIIANGSKKPSRTKRSRDAIRLLIEKDGRTVEQVERAIRWCQADEFWRGNILSASKLREQYDRLRLAAERERGQTGRGLPANQERAMSIINEYAQEEMRRGEITDS